MRVRQSTRNLRGYNSLSLVSGTDIVGRSARASGGRPKTQKVPHFNRPSPLFIDCGFGPLESCLTLGFHHFPYVSGVFIHYPASQGLDLGP